MSGKDIIEVEGWIVGSASGGSWWAELENGYRLVARLPGKLSRANFDLKTADRVVLQVSPFDLSKGFILKKMS